ncbi:hypothetical protein FOXYSP1_04845 [Fusarium oxysporum f. sp. phaseoli]
MYHVAYSMEALLSISSFVSDRHGERWMLDIGESSKYVLVYKRDVALDDGLGEIFLIS